MLQLDSSCNCKIRFYGGEAGNVCKLSHRFTITENSLLNLSFETSDAESSDFGTTN